MDLFDEVKFQICGRGFISKDNRAAFLLTLFSTAQKQGINKEAAKRSLDNVSKEILGDTKRIPKDKRDFIVKITKEDVLESFYEVYGIEVERVEPKVVVKEVKKEEVRTIDFSNLLDDEYAKRRGIVQGKTFNENLDVDFCKKIGIL